MQATNTAKNIVHAISSGEDCDDGAWLARNATENMPIATKSVAIGLIEPFSKLAVKTGKIGIYSIFVRGIVVWQKPERTISIIAGMYVR